MGNPYKQTQANGFFSSDTVGAIQGLIRPDPDRMFRVSQGYVDTNETKPMYGGVAVSEHVGLINGMGNTPASGASLNNGNLGTALKRATSNTDLAGFAVFDAGAHMVIDAEHSAPAAYPSNSIAYVRLGSGIRIPLKADPALISSQLGQLTTGAVAWDFTAQRLVAASGGNGLNIRLLEIYETGGTVVSENASGEPSFVNYNNSGSTPDSVLALVQI